MAEQGGDLSGILDLGRSIRVGILLFPDVEVLDFAGPFEVFSVASRVAKRDLGRTVPAFEVATVAAQKGKVVARHGLVVEAMYGFDDAPDFDLFVVPGGVVTGVLEDQTSLDYVVAANGKSTLTASVCTGSFILAKADLVGERTVTTHWEDIDDLRKDFPGLKVAEGVPFVDEGDIISSAGISAGIGMSLHIVGKVLGTAMARGTARQMQYDWVPAEA